MTETVRQDALADRKKQGAREPGRDEHYALCDGPGCPCYREGWAAGYAAAHGPERDDR